MNILFLRGRFPTDRANPKEILYSCKEDETDVYTEMMYAFCAPKDHCTMLYWGHRAVVRYSENFEVRFVPDFESYGHERRVDLIIARGGFPEYQPILRRHHWALKAYYGAGRRAIPEPSFSDYDLILADSKEQIEDIRLIYPYKNVQLWLKPASHIFRPLPFTKKYDVCYVAIHPKDPRKRLKYVYETLPSDLRVLQLGNYPKRHKPPPNVTVKLVRRESMPKAMSKCKVGIAPYSKDDSAPRCVSEFLACGLPVVGVKGLRIWQDRYPIRIVSKDAFWNTVRLLANEVQRGEYQSPKCDITVKSAAQHLRMLVESLTTE